MVSTRKVKAEGLDYAGHPLDEYFKTEDSEEEQSIADYVPLQPDMESSIPNQSQGDSSTGVPESRYGATGQATPNELSQAPATPSQMFQTPQSSSFVQTRVYDESDWDTNDSPFAPKHHRGGSSLMSTPTGRGTVRAMQSRLPGQFPVGRGRGSGTTRYQNASQMSRGVQQNSDYTYYSLHPLHLQFHNVEQVAHAEHLARSGLTNCLFKINNRELVEIDENYRAHSYAEMRFVNNVHGWYRRDNSLVDMHSMVVIDALADLCQQKYARGIPLPRLDFNNLGRVGNHES
ncbi:hypothetical protein F4818DRAFT_452088 [Hypoxylon cercidicola]|nr:hypothetical protein F4818DRAFT_452088 [Hypoxylon cercidicola]